MSNFENERIEIPTTWTGHQANTVVEFLHRVCDAIWCIHEANILKHMRHEDFINDMIEMEEEIPMSDPKNDDIPF